MKRHRHLLERVISLENLFAAAKAAMKGKRSTPAAARFFAEQEKEVVALEHELRTGTYRHGAYHYFQIHEPKERTVAAAPFRDRVVDHAIVRVLEPIFDRRFIEDSFACRKGKGTHAALRRCAEFTGRYRYALKCDVAKYFPSIDQGTLLEMMERVIADEGMMALIREILESHRDGEAQEWTANDLWSVRVRPRGIPIGNLTSQFFANVYLNALDHFVKHTLRVRGYVRYVDDFVLFSDDKAQLREWGAAILDMLATLRLRIHPDKYRLLPTSLGVDFVGFVCFANGRRKVRTANVRAFQRRLRDGLWRARRGEVPLAAVSATVRSWVAHAAHAQSWGLRAAMFSRI